MDDGDGVFEWTDAATGDGVWDSGEGEQWTITDATGRYRLYSLTAGTPYNVRYVIPAGYVPSTPLVVNKTLAANEQYNAADFGLRPPGTSTIGDTLWIDANENGVVDAGETPIANVDVRLYADTNNNGAIDSGDLLLQTVTTDANGNYLFTGVAGSASAAGNYLVDVVETDPDFPAGLELVSGGSPITTPPPNGLHDVTINAEATPYLTADFGYNWAGSIGDFVWWDYNTNQAYDPGAPANEVGIANAIVLLYVDANNNGVLDPANGDYQYGGPAFTGACPGPNCGNYLFDNLPPGNYLVDVYEDSITTDGVRDIVPTTDNVVVVNLAAGEPPWIPPTSATSWARAWKATSSMTITATASSRRRARAACRISASP